MRIEFEVVQSYDEAGNRCGLIGCHYQNWLVSQHTSGILGMKNEYGGVALAHVLGQRSYLLYAATWGENTICNPYCDSVSVDEVV